MRRMSSPCESSGQGPITDHQSAVTRKGIDPLPDPSIRRERLRVGAEAYLASPATRLIVVAMITAPNR